MAPVRRLYLLVFLSHVTWILVHGYTTRGKTFCRSSDTMVDTGTFIGQPPASSATDCARRCILNSPPCNTFVWDNYNAECTHYRLSNKSTTISGPGVDLYTFRNCRKNSRHGNNTYATSCEPPFLKVGTRCIAIASGTGFSNFSLAMEHCQNMKQGASGAIIRTDQEATDIGHQFVSGGGEAWVALTQSDSGSWDWEGGNGGSWLQWLPGEGGTYPGEECASFTEQSGVYGLAQHPCVGAPVDKVLCQLY